MKKLIRSIFYKKTKIFISGKVSGCDFEETKMKFRLSSVDVIIYGIHNHLEIEKMINPVELGLTFSNSWLKCMAVTIWHLLPCSHIYMLKDWKESKGANVERWISKRTFKTIIYEQ